MKIVIAMPPAPAGSLFELPFMVPLAIYALTAILQEQGHEVMVMDPCAHNKLLVDPDEFANTVADADLIGLSCNSFNWATGLSLLQELKKRIPWATTVVGGVHPTHMGLWIMEHSPATFAIAGEGEVALSMLVKALQGKLRLAQVPNLYYRDEGGDIIYNGPGELLRMEEYRFPLPAYELVPAGIYQYLTYETSRGCYGGCSFCSIPFKHSWRGKAPEQVIEELSQVVHIAGDKTKNKMVYFTDDCFTADRERARLIAEGIAATNLPVSLAIEARANDVFHPGLLEGLSAAKVGFIQIGVECGYDEGLRRIRKGITTVRVKEAAQELKQGGMINKVMFSFIVGLPWETEKECLQTVHFAAELVATYGGKANTAWWFPVPSELWNKRAEFGIISDEKIFDRGAWTGYSADFEATHPNLSQEGRRRVNMLIEAYNEAGIRVRD